MIDLGGTQPPWPTRAADRFAACLAHAARSKDLWRVPAPQGEEGLRNRIGERFGLEPADITITSGIRAAALTYSRECKHILVERPTFPGVLHALGHSRAEVQQADWKQLLHGEIPAESAVWLTSPFRNPDGATLSAADHAALEDRAAAGHRVVVNAAYAWFADALQSVNGADTLGSFHKIAGHGVRLGWVHSRSYFERAVPELLGTTPPRVWQCAWSLFLDEEEFAILAASSVTSSRDAGLAFAEQARKRLGWHCPEGPHLLLRLKPGVTEDDAVSRLRAGGYSVAKGSAFGSPEPAIRISFLGVDPEDAATFADSAQTVALLAGPIGSDR
jgi:DNA-binding transcriptional MocR family regulator